MYGIYEGGKVIAKFVAPMSVRSNRPVFVSDTLSLKRATHARSTQRWEIETKIEPFNTSGNDFMVSLITKGFSEVATVLVPQNYAVINKRGSDEAIKATSDRDKGSAIILIKEATGVIPKGTFVRFDGHTKVYMTTLDIDIVSPPVENPSNDLVVYPPIVADVIEDEEIRIADNVIMYCHYDTNTRIGMQYSDGILTDNGVVKMVEKL